MREELLPPLNTLADLKAMCSKNKSVAVLFWLDNSSASLLFKDCMIYQQGKLCMQPGKFIPKIAGAQLSDTQAYRDLCKYSNVTEFPTLILFDAQANPIRTVIGFSWFEAPNLYQTQRLLL